MKKALNLTQNKTPKADGLSLATLMLSSGSLEGPHRGPGFLKRLWSSSFGRSQRKPWERTSRWTKSIQMEGIEARTIRLELEQGVFRRRRISLELGEISKTGPIAYLNIYSPTKGTLFTLSTYPRLKIGSSPTSVGSSK